MRSRSLLLIGLRGVGKTVLLKYLAENARCSGVIPVVIEVRNAQSDFEELAFVGSPEEEETDSDLESAFEKDYFIEGYNLDVDKLAYGEALLNWPSRVLCSEDCKGLCPVCGQNLNRSECGCDRTQLDPRMAKVLDIFSNFKEV